MDISTGQWTVLLPYTRFDISEPVHYRNYILFRSAYTTIENIYAFDINRQKLYQVTFSRFGAYNPSVSPDSSELLFSTYTDTGFDVSQDIPGYLLMETNCHFRRALRNLARFQKIRLSGNLRV